MRALTNIPILDFIIYKILGIIFLPVALVIIIGDTFIRITYSAR